MNERFNSGQNHSNQPHHPNHPTSSEASLTPETLYAHQSRGQKVRSLLNPDEIHPEAFTDVHDQATLARHARYVARKDAEFNSGTIEQKLSQQFETIFLDGIRLGNWLGSTTTRADHTIQQNFFLDARPAAKYDDYRHRADVIATLDFTEPIEDDYGELSQAVLAFDVTINSDPATIRDKLTRAYNDDAELPFGFTHLDYYQSSDSRGTAPMVPRYVIGTSKYDLKNLQEISSTDSNGHLHINRNSARALIDRFKVLSEIRAQNELFDAMLPDDWDDARVQKAASLIGAVDECLDRALKTSAELLLCSPALPESVRQKARSGSAYRTIEEYLLKSTQAEYSEWLEEQHRRGNFHYGPQDTYVEIVTSARKLSKAALDGELEDHRQIRAHNQLDPELKARQESRTVTRDSYARVS